MNASTSSKYKAPLKIVLLPGMDGTGALLADFLACYPGESLVIPLPEKGGQSYEELYRYLVPKLPTENIILVAESFSGGLVPRLLSAENNHIKGVIFIASFLSCSRPRLLKIASLLPIAWLTKLPGVTLFYRKLFFGPLASAQAIAQFKQIISRLPASLLHKRINSILKLKIDESKPYLIPCAYLRPSNDLLIPQTKVEEVKHLFPNASLHSMKGPHFILQTQAQQSADIVMTIVRQMSSTVG